MKIKIFIVIISLLISYQSAYSYLGDLMFRKSNGLNLTINAKMKVVSMPFEGKTDLGYGNPLELPR